MRAVLGLHCSALILVVSNALSQQHQQQQQPTTKKNVVFVVTDDQDMMLGGGFPSDGEGPMPQTARLLGLGGMTALNFFAHTPICCPSRSEVLTGKYFHNIKAKLKDEKDSCMHVDLSLVEDFTFMRTLQEAGYATGLFGKFLNRMPAEWPPLGFDAWMANAGGDYFSPSFQVHGIHLEEYDWPDGTVHTATGGYTTSIVGNVSKAWIESTKGPFFAYVAPKAAHEPFNPAPWYRDHWDDSRWPQQEPRPENWNCSAEARRKHHGNIATAPMLSTQAATVITEVFKNRWRTLISVDDLIVSLVDTVEKMGLTEETYFFFSSDHGFQLGEFNILMDKRQPYDWNTRIPLLVRGPDVAAGSKLAQLATLVDLAPTFLHIAGLNESRHMDGKSLLPLLLQVPAASKWRDSVLLEYYFNSANTKCVGGCRPQPGGGYPISDSSCGDLANNTDCWGAACDGDCYPTESTANNFIALRTTPASTFGDSLYVEFESGDASREEITFAKPDFYELYDLANDRWSMRNIYDETSPQRRAELHEIIQAHYTCAGGTCP